MMTNRDRHFDLIQVSEQVNPDGTRTVYGTIDKKTRACGKLMPQISDDILATSPGISAWSKPNVKVDADLEDGGATILNFSAYWERHYQRTYPLHDDGQEV